MKDYVEAILYRYMRGISDLADRNFLMVGGRVISIDEDIEGHQVKIVTELRKNKADFVYEWIKKNYDQLDVKKWEVCSSDKDKMKRLEEIQCKKDCLKLFEN